MPGGLAKTRSPGAEACPDMPTGSPFQFKMRLGFFAFFHFRIVHCEAPPKNCPLLFYSASMAPFFLGKKRPHKTHNRQHRLVKQINLQRMPAAPAKSPENGIFPRPAGKKRSFLPVDRPSQPRAQQKPAQVRQKREIVRRSKRRAPIAQKRKIIPWRSDISQSIATYHQQRTQNAQRPYRQFAKYRPQKHTSAQAVQHPEPDDNVYGLIAQKIHPGSHSSAEQTAGKYHRPSLHRLMPKGDADTGNQQKQHAAPVFQEHKKCGIVKTDKLVQFPQVIDKMNDNHA